MKCRAVFLFLQDNMLWREHKDLEQDQDDPYFS